MTPQELKAEIANGRKKFDKVYLNGDFSNMDLSGISLCNSQIAGLDFTGANLHLCNLMGAEFFDCYFDNANMTFSNLSGTDFKECRLVGAHFFNSDIFLVNFASSVIAYKKGDEIGKEIQLDEDVEVFIFNSQRWHKQFMLKDGKRKTIISGNDIMPFEEYKTMCTKKQFDYLKSL